ncbi:BtrH N-terminal domain-containing protein [Fictibacillus enclensis]|uniref:BtrH N-terminal domain-containing protein n=1 Tax=Fictibacillus enclensis TaxID=1017270 RepID=UPI0025A03BEB|nr:BtrH N-terminal domain-containing protein [Fictibacillus enclensis]MDM5335814.1 BtrH N-terminal domain-containing protein [Fictibacillus enclensis]
METGGMHCLYYSIKRYLNDSGINLTETDVFHLMGGYAFHYHVDPSSAVPYIQIFGTNMDLNLFLSNTGIELKLNEETDEDKADDELQKVLEADNKHLVYANCFYLPFDTLNYQKNYDDHLLYVHAYDSNRLEYIVSDHRSELVRISKQSFQMARKKLVYGHHHTLNLNLDTPLPITEIKKNINHLIFEQAKEFSKKAFLYLVSFSQELEEIDQVEDGVKKELGFHNISKALKASHGPIITRKLMSKSVEELDQQLSNKFYTLANLWDAFANRLVRYTISSNVLLQDLLKEYDKIVSEELYCANQLQKLLTVTK